MLVSYEYKRLIGRIIEKYGTRRAFAKEIDMSEAYLSKKLKGKIAIKQNEMVKWAGLLDIDVSEIGDYFFA